MNNYTVFVKVTRGYVPVSTSNVLSDTYNTVDADSHEQAITKLAEQWAHYRSGKYLFLVRQNDTAGEVLVAVEVVKVEPVAPQYVGKVIA